ncbi:unnamed protein product [Spirodela intermedia]|uniref:Disease resistance N-terminal domain-containing protein n=1 Tax=Spirodela intermedia TaxID=51605 RepID=A0ABN7ECQ0_SPIIN|nr:unnamed protein product [Spirodela intermedia]
MAETAISPILYKLNELLSQEIKQLAEVKPQFESLQMKLWFINTSLAGFYWNRAQVPPPVRELVQQLREAVFEADNIIDDFYLTIDRKKRSGIRGSLKMQSV